MSQRLFSKEVGEQSRIVKVCAMRLGRLKIGRHPALRFSPGLEGYREYVFGARAGPEISATNLFHELGHAAQFGGGNFRYRATVHGFLFKSPRKIYVAGTGYPEPATAGATERELQAIAFQLHLMQSAGYSVREDAYFEKGAQLMKYMEDWWHVPGVGEEGRLKTCKDKIARYFHETSASEVADRLEAWLDATKKRLSGPCQKESYRRVPCVYNAAGVQII